MANTFHLQVVTPSGMMVDEQVEFCSVRTTEGDLGVLHGHENYMAAIEVGRVKVRRNGEDRLAAVSDGFVHVTHEETKVVVTTMEWADEIDVPRAESKKEDALKQLEDSSLDASEKNLAQFRLKKARNRLKIAETAKK